MDLKYFEAAKLSLYANIFSTLIGVIIALAYSSSDAFLLFWILGSIFLFIFFNYISKRTGFLKDFAKIKILLPLPFFFIGLIGLIFGNLLTPFLREPYFKHESPSLLIGIISLIILLILGLIITFLSEGYVITRLYSEKSDKIVSTVMSMNLISYIVLVLIFILFV